jgi:hypothetical protein
MTGATGAITGAITGATLIPRRKMIRLRLNRFTGATGAMTSSFKRREKKEALSSPVREKVALVENIAPVRPLRPLPTIANGPYPIAARPSPGPARPPALVRSQPIALFADSQLGVSLTRSLHNKCCPHATGMRVGSLAHSLRKPLRVPKKRCFARNSSKNSQENL